MKRLLYSLFCLFLSTPAFCTYAFFSWPLSQVSSQHRIVRTFGAYQNYSNVFMGIDIATSSGGSEQVYPIWDGTVIAVDRYSGYVAVEHEAGDVWTYSNLSPNTIPPFVVGSSVVVCGVTSLGYSKDQKVSLQCYFDDKYHNPVFYIKPFIDQSPPIIDTDTVRFVADETNTDYSAIDSTSVVFGQVDILCKAYDKEINSDGTGGGNRAVPYMLDYKILDLSHKPAPEAKWFWTVAFDDLTSGMSAYSIYAQGTSGGDAPEYVYRITNYFSGSQYSNGYWNTNEEVGGIRTFPDGRYGIQLLAHDIARMKDLEDGYGWESLNQGEAWKDVIVDNDPPAITTFTYVFSSPIKVNCIDYGVGCDTGSLFVSIDGSSVTARFWWDDTIIRYDFEAFDLYKGTHSIKVQVKDKMPNQQRPAEKEWIFTYFPCKITDLEVAPWIGDNPPTAPVTANSIRLTWTAPRGDDNKKIVAAYEVWSATFPITDENLPLLTPTTYTPESENEAEAKEFYTVNCSSHGTKYYFIIRGKDVMGNYSESSACAGTTLLDVPFYSQRYDSPLDGWAWDRFLGSDDYIRDAGCTLTCIAMLLNYYADYHPEPDAQKRMVKRNPGQLNKYMKDNNAENKLFDGDTKRIVFSDIVNISSFTVQLVIDTTTIVSNNNILNSELINRSPPILVVNNSGHSHFVVAIGSCPSAGYIINDPGFQNDIRRTLKIHYNNRYSRIITFRPVNGKGNFSAVSIRSSKK